MSHAMHEAIRAALRTVGAIEVVSIKTLSYEIETSVGTLRIVPGNGVIRCRFEDAVSARKKVLCKRRSGRWDHFQHPNESMKEFVDDFGLSLMYLKTGAPA